MRGGMLELYLKFFAKRAAGAGRVVRKKTETEFDRS
jgi:hypothetical protein